MAGISRSRRRRNATLVAAALGVSLAACGSDAPATTSATGATTTRLTSSTTTSTAPPRTTTTVLDGPTPIPTDPAELLPCPDVDPGEPALMPSRRWPTLAAGWKVRYAYTTRPEGTLGLSLGWSTLVQVGPDERVTGLLVVSTGPQRELTPPNTTVRGAPAWLGPEVTRGGATGALQSEWDEDGRTFVATARGVDEADLRALLEDLEIEEGAVTGGPAAWRFLGSGQTDGAFVVTMLGVTPPDTDLLDTGYAPIEVSVEERAAGSDPTGPVHAPNVDVVGLDVRLRDLDGRPALVTLQDEGMRLVHTTTIDGDAVTVSGAASEADLLAIASGTRRIEAGDERLVGVPIGNVGSSPGRWCR